MEGVNLTPAEKRRDLVYQELQLFLAEMQHRKPADSVQQFEDQLARDRSRLDQMRQLLDQTQKEFDREKERAKGGPPPKKPLGDPIDDTKARQEIERQRARVLLDDLKRQAAEAEGTMLVAAADAQKATLALQLAQAKVAELRDKIAVAQKELDELGGTAKPAAPFEIRDANGNRIPFAEADAAALKDLALKLFKESRGELTGGKGTPFATAARWQQLQKTGHVLVRVDATEILVPVSGTRVPEFILARSGDTYRAVFDFPEQQAKALQKAVAALAK